MNLTEQEWAEIQRRLRVTAPQVKQDPGKLPRGPNKWELLYSKELAALEAAKQVTWWAFETVRFRLADGAWYKPDFAVMFPDGHLELHEVKGHWREAARIRIKVAADRHPFLFVALTRKNGGWQREYFAGGK